MAGFPNDLDLGPLPEGDRQDTLQQLSLKALQSRLPENKLLFRRESEDDKGVDGLLEAKVEVPTTAADGTVEVKTHFTNCRGHAQLKGTDKPRRLKDGTVTLQVETSNLNYLLNGQSPLYFLWIAPTDELRYAWAREEWQRLEADDPEWMQQEKITLHFRDVLTPAAVDEMQQRIITESRLAREIHESLARSALSDRVIISIDPQTLQSTDPQQIHEWLTAGGMTIVSAGYGRRVVEWFALLNPDARGDARVQLVAGYAEATLGKYHAATAHLAGAALRRLELSAADRQFLDYLRGACEYQTGRIDLAEYLRREEAWAARQPPAAAAAHRLEVLRQGRTRERDPHRRAELLAEMRTRAAEVQAAADATPAHKLQARIMVLGAEGDDLTVRFVEETVRIQTRQGLGRPVTDLARAAADGMNLDWQGWEATVRAIVEEAVALKHPLLLADALSVRVTIHQSLLLLERMNAAWTGRRWEPAEARLHALMRDADTAKAIYAQAGNLEGETRAKLLLADLFESLGHGQAARNLAEGALVAAEAMSYPRLAGHARDHLDQRTEARQFEALLAERLAVDDDVHLAGETDEVLRGVARHTLDTLGLPADRLPILEREWGYYRAIARERVDWCRHLDLIQDPRSVEEPATYYHDDPPRACRCEKHGYRSTAESPDGAAVIAAFKAAYCASCPDRAPKGRQRSC
jgi:hypothetical protein